MSDVDSLALAREALRGIPLMKDYRGEIVRLGGLTNLVFALGEYCLRIPGKGTEEYIDRSNEAVAAREAARAGVSPEVLHFDDRSGVMLTRFIAGAETMSPQNFRRRAGSPARAAKAFRKLHDSGAKFPFRFELFSMIDDYLKILSTKDVALPAGYHDVVREAEVVRLYAQGLSVTQIAETVRRSVKTVSKQKNDAMRKLGLESNRELYEFARASGLLA